MGHFIGIALIAFVGIAIGTLFGGIILFASTRMLARFDPSLRAACKTVLLATLTNVVISIIASNVAQATGLGGGATISVLMTVVGWLVYAAYVARFIRHPQTGPIGFRRAMMVSLGAIVLACLGCAAIYFGFSLLKR